MASACARRETAHISRLGIILTMPQRPRDGRQRLDRGRSFRVKMWVTAGVVRKRRSAVTVGLHGHEVRLTESILAIHRPIAKHAPLDSISVD